MVTKAVADAQAKSKKVKPRIRLLKYLYACSIASCFLVVIWLGYQAFLRLSQGYDVNTLDKVTSYQQVISPSHQHDNNDKEVELIHV